MSAKLRIDNFDENNIGARTTLSADLAAASTTILVTNGTDFSVGNYIFIGTLGSQNCEMVSVSSVTSASLVVSAVVFAHQQNEPVTAVQGNEIKVYSSANVDNLVPADTSFTSIATISLTQNQLYTDYTDAAGSTNTWYKFTYYNSTTLQETLISDSAAVRGGGYGNYAGLDEIRAEAGMTNNTNISDSDIAKKRQRAQNIINGILGDDYTIPFAVPVPPLINTCCIMLAAGYLLLEDYGTAATGMSKDGNAKISHILQLTDTSGNRVGAPGILDLIKMREIIIRDEGGNSLLIADLTSSYPNNKTDPTTLTSDTNSFDTGSGVQLGRYFTMSDRF